MFNRLCQQISRFRWHYQKFTLFSPTKRQKSDFQEILSLNEAASYLSIDLGTLVEEVYKGHLPGGKLAGKWLFSRTALREHFSRYQRAGTKLDNWLSVDKEFENSNEQTAQNLIERYHRGERNFTGVQLSEESFYQAFLSGIILTNAALVEADLCEVDLSAADLSGANLRGASLIKTDLSEANLEGSDLTDACLISADLRWANLKKACFRKADLTGANLVGADLTGADLTETILDAVRWNKNDSKAY